MAQFEPAYRIVDRNEQYYVNDPADPGGETYRGIARKLHPNWEGWITIDFYKSRFGKIPYNVKFSTLYPPGSWVDDVLVPNFFKYQWKRSRAGEIVNQQVANIYFDFYILHTKAVKAMQEALNQLGFNVMVDNIIGPQTLGAINRANPAQLHDAYKAQRQKYHEQRSGSKFYKGWIVRNNKFPTLHKPTKQVKAGNNTMWWVIGLSALATGFFLHGEHLTNQLNSGDYE